MIKKLTLIVWMVLAFLVGPLEDPLEAAKWRTQDFGAVVDLVVGTSAVYDTSTVINPQDWGEIHLFVSIDITSGGGAGAGLVHIEGRVDTALAWIQLWMIDVADSMKVKNNIAFSSTADVSIYAIVAMPQSTIMWQTVGTETLRGGSTKNPLGLTQLRAIVTDTNWNAAAVVEGYWLLKRE